MTVCVKKGMDVSTRGSFIYELEHMILDCVCVCFGWGGGYHLLVIFVCLIMLSLGIYTKGFPNIGMSSSITII